MASLSWRLLSSPSHAVGNDSKKKLHSSSSCSHFLPLPRTFPISRYFLLRVWPKFIFHFFIPTRNEQLWFNIYATSTHFFCLFFSLVTAIFTLVLLCFSSPTLHVLTVILLKSQYIFSLSYGRKEEWGTCILKFDSSRLIPYAIVTKVTKFVICATELKHSSYIFNCVM